MFEGAARNSALASFDELAKFVCALMASAPVGILVLREGCTCVAANSTVLARVSQLAAHAGSQSLLEAASREFEISRRHSCALQSAFSKAQAGKASILETDHPPLIGPRQGQWRVHCLPFVVDAEQGVAVMLEELTEQRTATEAYQSVEQRFRLLVDAASDGIIICGAPLLLYANSAATSLLGYQTPDDLVGRPLGDFVEAYHQARFEDWLVAVNSDNGARTLETVFLRRGGDPFAAECRTSQTRVDEVGAAVLFFRDITEQKRQQLRREDARRVEGLARLSAAVGNELQGYAARLRHLAHRLVDTLEERPATNSGIFQLADEIGERAKQFELTAPCIRNDSECILLEELLGRVCSRLTERASSAAGPSATASSQHRGEILIDLEPVEYAIRGDAAIIERGLVTLAMAVWNSASLALPLRIWGTRDSKLAQGGTGTYRLNVAGGSSKGRIPAIANRASPVPEVMSQYSSWEQGRDLELLAAFAALQSQGSRIEVQPGAADCFQIELPLYPSRAATAVSLAPTNGIPSSSGEAEDSVTPSSDALEPVVDTECTGVHAEPVVERDRLPILICDDEARLVSLTAGLLREFGFEVLTARTGAEALGVVATNPVDVIVLDVNLPGEDASDIVARIHDVSGAKVILSSGYTEEDIEPALLNAPIVKKFLSKPYTVDVLVRAIDAVRQEQSEALSTAPPIA